MLNALLSLFTSFNPVILGLMVSAGAYIALRHRALPPARHVLRHPRRAWR